MHCFLCTILVVHGFDDHSVWFNMKKRSSLGWQHVSKASGRSQIIFVLHNDQACFGSQSYPCKVYRIHCISIL